MEEACERNDTEEVRALITALVKLGDDFEREAVVRNAASALYWAAKNENVELVSLLIENGADLNQRKGGFGPLVAAIEKGHLEVSFGNLKRKHMTEVLLHA